MDRDLPRAHDDVQGSLDIALANGCADSPSATRAEVTSPAGTPPAFAFSSIIIPDLAKALDCLAIVVAALLSLLASGELDNGLHEQHAGCLIFILFCYILISGPSRLYSTGAIMRPITSADDVALSIVVSFLIFLSFFITFRVNVLLPIDWVLLFAAYSVVSTIALRVALSLVLKRLSRRGVIGHRVAIFGCGAQADRFIRSVQQSKPYFTAVIGAFRPNGDAAGDDVAGVPVLGDLDALIERARRDEFEDVVIAMPWQDHRTLTRVVDQLRELPLNIFLATDLAGFEIAFRPAAGSLGQLPLFEVTQRPISGWSNALKTIEDYVFASAAFVLLLPLMGLIAMAIKFDSPGPVFFKQKRLGFNNREFDVYKFRSMYHRAQDEIKVRQATRGDPRVTRVGRIIRATSLDELPQLLNVLNGTMSLVGPRPHAISHNEEYGQAIRGYFARHRIKPGITGWAQVNGLRGETDTIAKMEERIRHDLYYAENWSFVFDLRILVMTALTVLFQKTAY